MPEVSIRQLSARQIRIHLLDAAWDLIRRNGIERFTLRALAKEAGVALGLANRHFGSREELLDELRLRVFEELDRLREQSVAGQEFPDTWAGFETRIRRSIDQMIEYGLCNPHLFALLAYGPENTISARVSACGLESAKKIEQILIEANFHGYLRMPRNPVAWVMGLWSSIISLVQRINASVHPAVRDTNRAAMEILIDAMIMRLRDNANN